MLDRVGDVNPPAVDPRLVQRTLEEAPGGPDKRLSLKVLLVTRLLADEHHPAVFAAFAEDRLRRLDPEIAGLARGGRLSKLLDAPGGWRRLCHRSNNA